MHGTVRQSHATRTDGTVPCMHTRMGQSRTRMGQSHTRIHAIIIDHPVPSNFTGILWHWIIYFTLNNIQTPMPHEHVLPHC